MKCYAGLTDYGELAPEQGDDTAKEALVFMVAGLTGSWKYPIVYFFINHMPATTQVKFVRAALGRLIDAGLQ